MENSRAQKIAVSGSTGKLGREILEIIGNEQRQLIAEMHEEQNIETFAEKALSAVVVIDFSAPELVRSYLCLKNKTPKAFVSGTTGLTSNDRELYLELSKKIPVLWAPNFSLGVCFVNSLLEKFSALKGFDFQIEEIHHNKKKDAPSGTAIFLQQTLKAAVAPQPVPEPLSVRAGGVFGVHKIMAISDDEQINLEHIALKRSVFARGAVVAADFLVQQTPGIYHMKDVLNWIG